MLTLNIPDMDNVRLDVLTKSRNSENSRKNASTPPARTKLKFTASRPASSYLKKSLEDAISIPRIY